MYLPEPVLETRTLGAIAPIGHLFAKLVLPAPQMLAMLCLPAVAGRRRLTVSGTRRLTDRHLADPRHRDLSLSMSGLRERAGAVRRDSFSIGVGPKVSYSAQTWTASRQAPSC
jgi:hypothetical protein